MFQGLIYSVLESLALKGWIRIYSGMSLLFRADDPRNVFEKAESEFDELVSSIQATLDRKAIEMKEKFVILNFDVGLENLKEAMGKAKTIWISNATTDFLKKVRNTFSKDVEVKVILFPGAERTADKNVQFKEAEMKIVCMIRNKEVPSTSIVLDESRTFTVIEDLVEHRYIVDEMLYDECTRCFTGWHNLGWNTAKNV